MGCGGWADGGGRDDSAVRIVWKGGRFEEEDEFREVERRIRDVLSKDSEPRGLGLSFIKKELWLDQDSL